MTTGGVSVGDRDFVSSLYDQLGARALEAGHQARQTTGIREGSR